MADCVTKSSLPLFEPTNSKLELLSYTHVFNYRWTESLLALPSNYSTRWSSSWSFQNREQEAVWKRMEAKVADKSSKGDIPTQVANPWETSLLPSQDDRAFGSSIHIQDFHHSHCSNTVIVQPQSLFNHSHCSNTVIVQTLYPMCEEAAVTVLGTQSQRHEMHSSKDSKAKGIEQLQLQTSKTLS